MKRQIGLGILFLAFALCLAGCLAFPLGSAENSRVDPALQGYWLAEDQDSASLVALYPYDGHSYVLETFDFTKTGGERKFQSHASYKAWLTPVKGKTFITLDPLSQHLAGASEQRAYPVL